MNGMTISDGSFSAIIRWNFGQISGSRVGC